MQSIEFSKKQRMRNWRRDAAQLGKALPGELSFLPEPSVQFGLQITGSPKVGKPFNVGPLFRQHACKWKAAYPKEMDYAVMGYWAVLSRVNVGPVLAFALRDF